MMIALIAAMARDRVTGRDGAMPWHLPDEQIRDVILRGPGVPALYEEGCRTRRSRAVCDWMSGRGAKTRFVPDEEGQIGFGEIGRIPDGDGTRKPCLFVMTAR